MKIENQVCTLEQAIKLQALGINGPSFFLLNKEGKVLESWSVEGTEDKFYPAFTSSELGEMLPESIAMGKDVVACFKMCKENGYWEARYSTYKNDMALESRRAEAHARAEMLTYLLEAGYVKAAAINALLKKEAKP